MRVLKREPEILPPGRLLDIEVAINVMGMEISQGTVYTHDGGRWDASRNWCPLYSTSIEAAWAVVEQWEYNWNLFRDVGHSGGYETAGRGYGVILSYPGMPMAPVFGETAAHAICLAALQAANLLKE